MKFRWVPPNKIQNKKPFKMFGDMVKLIAIMIKKTERIQIPGNTSSRKGLT